MHLPRASFLLLLASALATPVSTVRAQTGADRLDSIARVIVAAAKYATFVTVDSAGRPRVRTIQPRPPEAGWSVWFATNPRTRKVPEIDRNPRVALHYFDPKTESYVAVTGRARVVRDRATKDAHWDPAWSAFYPDQDNSVVLVAIDADRIEVVSPRLGVDSDSATWRPQGFSPRTSRVRPRSPRRERHHD